MTECARRVGPLVDVIIPFSRDDVVEIEFVRSAILRVRFVPWRPKNERERTVPPNDIEICGREILLTPIARGGDNGLVFADHRLEIFNHFERDVVLLVAEIHKRAGVRAMRGDDDLNRTIWIDMRLCADWFMAAAQHKSAQDHRGYTCDSEGLHLS